MTDNLEALIPGGGMVAAALGLLGWFVKTGRDDRSEWRELLRVEREGRARDLSEERDRHDRALEHERERAERARSAGETVEGDLRRRLADAETAAAGWKDAAVDAARRAQWLEREYGKPPELGGIPNPFGGSTTPRGGS